MKIERKRPFSSSELLMSGSRRKTGLYYWTIVRNASQLKELYHAQLDYYAQALEQLLEKPVKEKIIYSFALKEEIIL